MRGRHCKRAAREFFPERLEIAVDPSLATIAAILGKADQQMPHSLVAIAGRREETGDEVGLQRGAPVFLEAEQQGQSLP